MLYEIILSCDKKISKWLTYRTYRQNDYIKPLAKNLVTDLKYNTKILFVEGNDCIHVINTSKDIIIDQ